MTRAPSRLRRALAACALSLGAVLAALVLAEVAARLLAPAGVPPDASEAPADRAPEGLPVLRTVADLARPHARGLHKGKPFRTNRDGFRGPEYPYQADPDVFRILVLGDSFTMGSGVEEWEAYPARLESLLNADAGPARFEVLNFGTSGMNLRASVRRLVQFGLAYRPALVVYGFTVNDIEGPAYRRATSADEAVGHMARYLRFADSPSYLLRAVWPRLMVLWDLLLPRPGAMGYELNDNYFNNPEAWQDFTAELDRLAEISRDAGICVHVLIHTQMAQFNRLHPWRAIYEAVSGAALERGLSVTETFPAYRSREPAEVRLSFFDGHPNARGHEILARELLAGLRALPEACGLPRPRGTGVPPSAGSNGA
ncbi:MAG: SGNH/GDSL hydrolase family protein [Deltaproteobacteria bacterium]|nr:MAG: SGNH/GDSL hydrolase family protein [Deltaproteobacteria bacterium]